MTTNVGKRNNRLQAALFVPVAGALVGCFLLGAGGCKSSGGDYSEAEIAQMKAAAAAAKDPSKESPEMAKQRAAATAALRATISTPPPGPPANLPKTP